ncbi:MAG: beta-ketoacyl synthase [Bacteroidales bacterium]|nr:beta-ketoacyl synthase [Bacteroidales bacterium]
MEKKEWNCIKMIYQISHNIISSLGFSSEVNYRAVKQGLTNLKLQENIFGLPTPFVGAIIDEELLNEEFALINRNNFKYTKFEKASILSIYKALENTDILANSDDVQFVLSSTKGNVHLLDNLNGFDSDRIYLWKSAQLIANFFENKNTPIIISNACISGASAQITAKRLLDNNQCKNVIVIGADMLSKFIVSGFQSFKALSPELCKPYDKNRIGLNLGEAAATIIYGKTKESALPQNTIVLQNGSMANDANHISGPSRTGAGLFLAINKVLHETNPDEIAFINAHGTATAYNDDMESLAFTSANLQERPINSLKAYFGHTLGAAGVLESIISSLAIIDNTALKVNNLTERGTVAPINSLLENKTCTENKFLKVLSGFGGSNAALLFKKM